MLVWKMCVWKLHLKVVFHRLAIAGREGLPFGLCPPMASMVDHSNEKWFLSVWMINECLRNRKTRTTASTYSQSPESSVLSPQLVLCLTPETTKNLIAFSRQRFASLSKTQSIIIAEVVVVVVAMPVVVVADGQDLQRPECDGVCRFVLIRLRTC